EQVEDAIRTLLVWVGENPAREGLSDMLNALDIGYGYTASGPSMSLPPETNHQRNFSVHKLGVTMPLLRS
ncbi:hypothetical protein ACCS48_34255, partial [Rhizobium brockwellii]